MGEGGERTLTIRKKLFVPKEPYIFSKDARYPKESLCQIMFYDYIYLVRLLGDMKKHDRWGRNNLRNHLSWVLARGDDRLEYCERISCPVCKKEPVSHFSARISRSGEASVDISYTCCGSLDCTEEIQAMGGDSSLVLSLQFSSIQIHSALCNIQEDICDVFRQAFKLPRDPDVLTAFTFFSAGAQLGLFLFQREENHD
ncbi:MAG: hypothetical protein ABH837_03415 [bacterium]